VKSLKLAWVDHAAAKKAVFRWHYSRTMPIGKLAKIGVFEDNKYIGCVIYGRGASPKVLKKEANLESNAQFVELVRVALDKHENPVSKILAISIKVLKKRSPNLKAIVSFADTKQGHLGKIYQAGNWIYTGLGAVNSESYILHGKAVHNRTITQTYYPRWHKLCKQGFEGNFNDYMYENVDPNMRVIKASPKFKYIYPLDNETRQVVLKHKKDYPKQL
tara:strand:- start:2843 stop:3496 length:654 start_codon:yes stop_codon:yes gene_type:complete